VQIAIPAASRHRPGQFYRVTLSDSGDECDCPDFFWRHIHRGDEEHQCKHIAAARQLFVDGIPGPRRRRDEGARPMGPTALAA
jgi:hypothetical protein